MSTNTISISIVSHGHKDLVLSLLSDINQQSNSAQIEVLLTLNIQNEVIDTARFENIKISVIRNDVPKGFGENHNSAFKLAKSSWFIVLNPDIRLLDRKLLASMIETASTAERAGIFAPRIVNSSGHTEDFIRDNLSPWSLFRRTIFEPTKRRQLIKEPDTRSKFFWIAGMFLLMPSTVFRETDGFDERYFLYCEDYDFCARVHLAGFNIEVLHELSAVHDAQRASHRSMKYLLLHIESLLKVWTSRTYWRITFL